ncbi:MAG: hypothetical protein RL732_1126 [Bacteroidota bacterium]|jgi:uncharacterized membrane protein YagU involved in acid resistance
MYNKFNSLRFVIGVFFSLLAIILAVGYFLSAEQHQTITMYTALSFGIFGLIMMAEKQNKEEN